MLRKPRSKRVDVQAAAIARASWTVSPTQTVVQARLRIPIELRSTFEQQNTSDRGDCWADGYCVQQNLALLYDVVSKLTGQSPSFIVDQDVTVMAGSYSATAPTQIEALLKLLNEVVSGKEI